MAQPGFEPRSVRLEPRASSFNYHAHCLLDEVQPDLVPASSWSIQPGLLLPQVNPPLRAETQAPPGDAPFVVRTLIGLWVLGADF